MMRTSPRSLLLASLLVAGCQGFQVDAGFELPYVEHAAEIVPPDGELDHEVAVAVLVEGDGAVGDTLVLGASDARSQSAALAAIAESRFRPGRRLGRSMATHAVMHFSFVQPVPRMSIRPVEEAIIPISDRTGGLELRCVQVQDLDAPPRLLESPSDVVARGRGAVFVQYFIDDSGTVRLPMVVASDQAALNKPAVEIVKRRRYAPPRRLGEPISVIVKQEIRFH